MPVCPHSPQNVADDKILCYQLQKQGAKAADERLAKVKTFPTKRSSGKLNEWWLNLKEGKKKKKLAMVIMASEYEPRLKQLDVCLGNLKSLKKQLLGKDGENKWLRGEMAVAQASQQQLKEEIDSLKMQLYEKDEDQKYLSRTMKEALTRQKQLEKEIESLKTQLWEKDEENQQLKSAIDYAKASRSLLETKLYQNSNSFRMQLKSTNEMLKSLKRQIKWDKNEIKSLTQELQSSQDLLARRDDRCSEQCLLPNIKLLELLPDLQRYNSNHEFWKKVREWLDIGTHPSQIVSLVRAKCPPEAWKALQEELNRNERILSVTSVSNPAQKESLFRFFRRSVSKALGPGTKLIHLFEARRQKDGESFEDYVKEKFRLYCSFGCDEESNDPDVNEQRFLHAVREGAAEEYKDVVLTNFVDMMKQASRIERVRREAERRNECLNCGKKGHVKACCRKPGGGAPAGPTRIASRALSRGQEGSLRSRGGRLSPLQASVPNVRPSRNGIAVKVSHKPCSV